MLNFTGWPAGSLQSIPEYAVDVIFDEFGISKSRGLDRPLNSRLVSIEDGRLCGATLRREGVTLCSHRHEHVDYYCHQEVVNTYYKELEAFVKQEMTGCQRAIIFNHQVRSYRKDILMGGARKPKDPVLFCHSDYSIAGAYRHLRAVCGADPAISEQEIAQYESGRRFAIIHAWRNISQLPVRDSPLALCTADTVNNEEDLVAYDLRYEKHTDGVMALRYNKNQRWIYFPDMCRDELLIFKQFDSASAAVNGPCCPVSENGCGPGDAMSSTAAGTNGLTLHFDRSVCQKVALDRISESCWVPHAAFQLDEYTEEGGARERRGRESIETAVLILY